MAMVEGSCSSLEPYALRVLGNSMEPELADGCVVIVDPGYAPKDGGYVVVEYAGDVFFRQLVVDGELADFEAAKSEVRQLRADAALHHSRGRGAAGGKKAGGAEALWLRSIQEPPLARSGCCQRVEKHKGDCSPCRPG